jgi:hypothetical protein
VGEREPRHAEDFHRSPDFGRYEIGFNDPHVCYAEYRSHDKSDVKVYWQKKTVGYADYRVGRYYISPFDLVDGEEKDLIDPIARRSPVLQVTRVELI